MSRFLLIGLDGADPALLHRWLGEDLLPHIGRMVKQGALLPCASTTPPATFPAWTTCVTGVNPGRHGIIDFTEMVPGRYAVQFVNASRRRAPALWNILSDAGKRVCVLGVPATYPPEPVNGCMVSGFDSPVCTAVDTSFVYPQDLYPQVRAWRFADFQDSRIGPGWHAMALSKLLEGIDVKRRIALALLEHEPWDFFMVVFGESDTVSHHFWMFHDPQSPRHRPGFENAIRDVYVRLDAAVGALMDAAGDDVVTAIVSDHGFGGAGTGVIHLNNALQEWGYLSFTHAPPNPLKVLALSITPETWRGALFRRFGRLVASVESRSRFGGIEWTRTRAWSEELNYFPSIRVNLAGREPEGQVMPSDYDAFCDELCGRLEEWQPIRKAWRRNELYRGPMVDRAPDIILETNLEDGYSHSCLRSRGGPSSRRIGPDEYVGGKERGMNGAHRPTGILGLSRPTRHTTSRLEDVAPTVLAAMGVPGPPMEGISLLGERELVDSGFVPRDMVDYSDEESRRIESRLRGLGYFE